MASRRTLKVAQAIREVVGMAILSDLNDPRIQNVTVTYVEVTGDLRSAKVNVSVMGDEKQQNLTIHGLQSAAGYLQAKCAKRIDMRYTPKLTFILDKGVKHSLEITRLLEEVLPAEPVDGTEIDDAVIDDLEPSDTEIQDDEQNE